jgi:hypothetical protein
MFSTLNSNNVSATQQVGSNGNTCGLHSVGLHFKPWPGKLTPELRTFLVFLDSFFRMSVK